VDYEIRKAGFARVAWIANPAASHGAPTVHFIDRVRSPHSLALLGIDGDGVPELVVGEHDLSTRTAAGPTCTCTRRRTQKGWPGAGMC